MIARCSPGSSSTGWVGDGLTLRFEDYRAGLGVDRAAEEADRAAGRRIPCPTLVLWSGRDDLADLHGDVLAIWAAWAPDVTGGPIDSGHHVAEEVPEELAGRIAGFLADDPREGRRRGR